MGADALQIVPAPLAAQQIIVSGYAHSNPGDIGMVLPVQIAGGGVIWKDEGAYQGYNAFSSCRVFAVNLNQVEEFTVQFTPETNPFLLLVFSNTPNPRPNDTGTFEFLVIDRFDRTVVAAGTRELEISSKYNGVRNLHGPYRLPGDFKYFRAFQYSLGFDDTTPGGALAKYGAATGPLVSNFLTTRATVTFYGK